MMFLYDQQNQNIFNRQDYSSDDSMPKVLFDESHEEVSIDDERGYGLSSFSLALRDEAFEVDVAKDMLLNKLNDANVLIIPFPKKKFQNNEIIEIIRFVEKGRGLLLSGEHGNLYGNADILNEISQRFQITFDKDRLTDVLDSYKELIELMSEIVGSQEILQFVKVKRFAEHPATTNIKEIHHYAGCSLKCPEEQALAWSTATAFSDKDIDRKHSPFEDVGHLTTVAFSEYKGRIVCIGDTSLLSNRFCDEADNKAFGINIIKYLAREI